MYPNICDPTPPISSALWECQCFMTTSLLPPSRTILTCFHGTILSGHSKSSLSPPCHLSFVFQVFHLASHLFPPSCPPSLFLFYFSSFCVLSFCPHFLLRTLDVKWQKEKRGKNAKKTHQPLSLGRNREGCPWQPQSMALLSLLIPYIPGHLCSTHSDRIKRGERDTLFGELCE